MAHRLLFPLATLYALIAVPLWLVLRSRHPAMIGATWHGHEMLFGFALAVIAGFLSTRRRRTLAWILAGTRLVARIAAATGSGPAAVIVGMTFPAAVFILPARPARGYYNALEDIQPARSFVVYAGEEHYPVTEGVEAIGITDMVREVSRAVGKK
jgi:uncharacterized protein involved in response to NO